MRIFITSLFLVIISFSVLHFPDPILTFLINNTLILFTQGDTTFENFYCYENSPNMSKAQFEALNTPQLIKMTTVIENVPTFSPTYSISLITDPQLTAALACPSLHGVDAMTCNPRAEFLVLIRSERPYILHM